MEVSWPELREGVFPGTPRTTADRLTPLRRASYRASWASSLGKEIVVRMSFHRVCRYECYHGGRESADHDQRNRRRIGGRLATSTPPPWPASSMKIPRPAPATIWPPSSSPRLNFSRFVRRASGGCLNLGGALWSQSSRRGERTPGARHDICESRIHRCSGRDARCRGAVGGCAGAADAGRDGRRRGGAGVGASRSTGRPHPGRVACAHGAVPRACADAGHDVRLDAGPLRLLHRIPSLLMSA